MCSGNCWAFPEHLRTCKVFLFIICVHSRPPQATSAIPISQARNLMQSLEAAEPARVEPIMSGSLDGALFPALEMLGRLSPQALEATREAAP